VTLDENGNVNGVNAVTSTFTFVDSNGNVVGTIGPDSDTNFTIQNFVDQQSITVGAGFQEVGTTLAPIGQSANNDSWLWTATKSFFSGFTVFGPKNDPRPSCFGRFLKDSAANFVGVPGLDTVAGGAAAYYGVSLSQAQAIPNTRVARGGISPRQWLEADEAARLTNAGKFSLALNAVVAESQALANQVPSALAGECK